MKRILGLILSVVSIISLAISAGSLIGVWVARPAVTSAVQDTLDLLVDTLTTTQRALQVSDQGLRDAADSVTTLIRSTGSLADSINHAGTALDSTATLVQDDLPKTIAAARTALNSAQDTARVVDNFLSGISRISFLNVNYNPEVPLNVAIGRISDSLNDLPATLTQIGGDLDRMNGDLPKVVKSVREMSSVIGPIHTALMRTRTVVGEYEAQLARARPAVESMRGGVPNDLTLFASILTFVLLWLIALQLMVLAIGWRWFKRGKDQQETPKAST